MDFIKNIQWDNFGKTAAGVVTFFAGVFVTVQFPEWSTIGDTLMGTGLAWSGLGILDKVRKAVLDIKTQ